MQILSMVATDDPLSKEAEGDQFNEVVIKIGRNRFRIKGHPFCFVGNTDEGAIKKATIAAKKFLKNQ